MVDNLRRSDASDARMSRTSGIIASTSPAGGAPTIEVEEELVWFALKFYRGQMSDASSASGARPSTGNSRITASIPMIPCNRRPDARVAIAAGPHWPAQSPNACPPGFIAIDVNYWPLACNLSLSVKNLLVRCSLCMKSLSAVLASTLFDRIYR